MTSAVVVRPSRDVVVLIVIPAVFTRPPNDVSIGIVMSTGVVSESDYIAMRVVVPTGLIGVRHFRLGSLHLGDIFRCRIVGTSHLTSGNDELQASRKLSNGIHSARRAI